MPFWTAGRAAMRSIHFNRCGNGSISSLVKPVRSQPLTHGHVLMSAVEYFPLPWPARYSLGSPEYLPDKFISRTPKTRSVSFLKRVIASGLGQQETMKIRHILTWNLLWCSSAEVIDLPPRLEIRHKAGILLNMSTHWYGAPLPCQKNIH
jgi:hypothetical protein